MPLRLKKRPQSQYWYVTGTHRGRHVYRSTGCIDRESADAVRVDLEQRCELAALYGEQAVATFAEAAESYQKAGGETRFLPPILEAMGATKLHEINQDYLDTMAARLYPAAKPATINRQFFVPVSAILRRAARNGLFNYFPIERRKTPGGRMRWLNPAEAERLIQSAPSLGPLITFALGTGLRRGELLKLDWADVRLDEQEADIWETKNGKPRQVQLPPRVVSTAKPLQKDRGVLFSNAALRSQFAAACRNAHIKDCTLHTLRHTWATWFYADTKDLLRLRNLGGWSSMAMLERYTKMAPASLKSDLATHGWNFDNAPSDAPPNRAGTQRANGTHPVFA